MSSSVIFVFPLLQKPFKHNNDSKWILQGQVREKETIDSVLKMNRILSIGYPNYVHLGLKLR